ncbi:acetate--CoA ligase family protein [Desulfoscipio geothermicus]|nr:acetate--CoA ligase family protein [Desulfoscipio geothermicus]
MEVLEDVVFRVAPLKEIDINPLLVYPKWQRVRAADALVVKKR